MKKVISIAAALIIALLCMTLTAHAEEDFVRTYHRPVPLSLPGMPKIIEGYTEYNAQYYSLITDRSDFGSKGFRFPLAEAAYGSFYNVSYQVSGARISYTYTLKDGYTLDDYLDFLDSKKSADQALENRASGSLHSFFLMDIALYMKEPLPFGTQGSDVQITYLINTDGTVLYQDGQRTGSGYGGQSLCVPMGPDENQPTEATEAPADDPEPVHDVPHIAGCESLAEGVKITWYPVYDAPLYRVYYKSSSGWKKMGDTSDTSFIDTDVRSGGTYVYTVRCLNADASAFISDFDHDGYRYTYNMDSPEITRFSDTYAGVRITWKPVQNAVKYRVYYKGSKGWTRMADTTETTYLDRDVRFGGVYTYTVRCITADGSRFTSDCSSTGWKHTHYLNTPQITSVQTEAQGVRISWNSVEDAEKYRVYYKGRNGWTKMADTAGTSFVDTDVRWGGTYTYTVRCVNAAGNTFTSSYDSSGTRHTHYLETPQITYFWDMGKGVRITWKAVDNAEKYRVYYYGRNGWTKMGETSDTSFIDDDVKVGSTYRYTVRAISNDLSRFTSDCNSTGWRHTYEPDLYAPNITNLEVTSNGIRISWDEVYGADMYRVYYKGRSGWTRMGDTKGTSYTDTDVSPDHTYTYTVRCLSSKSRGFASGFDREGRSIYYARIPYVSSLGITGDGMRVEWDAVKGAYEYRVFRKLTDGSWERVGTSQGTWIIDRDIKPFETYTYTVRCLDTNGFYNSWFESEGLTHTYYTPLLKPYIKTMMLSEDKHYLYVELGQGAVGVHRYALFLKVGDDWEGIAIFDGEQVLLDISELDYTFNFNGEYYFTVLGLNEDNEAVTDYDRSGYFMILLRPVKALTVEKTGDREYYFSSRETEFNNLSEDYYLIFTAVDEETGEELTIGPLKYDRARFTVDFSEYKDSLKWTCVFYGVSDDPTGFTQPYIMTFCEQDEPMLRDADEADIEELIAARK